MTSLFKGSLRANLTRDGVLEPHQTAEDAGEVADDGGEDADHADGHDEAGPAAAHAGRRDQGEDDLAGEFVQVNSFLAAKGGVTLAVFHEGFNHK
jgi:hypothetical protein